jgi:hypothetical protein
MPYNSARANIRGYARLTAKPKARGSTKEGSFSGDPGMESSPFVDVQFFRVCAGIKGTLGEIKRQDW